MSQSELTGSEGSAPSSDVALGDAAASLGKGAAQGTDSAARAPVMLSEAKAVALVIGLGFVWALMVFWVQQLTTSPTLWKDYSMWIKDLIFRFLIDWSFATVCFALLSTRAIALLMAFNLWMATAVLSFFLNYQRALSWLTITNQTGEGFAVAMVALEDAAPYLAALVPVSVLLTIVFHRFRPRVGQKVRLAKQAGFVWLVVVLGMHFDHKPLHRLEKFESADGIAHSYGYILTWIGESIYVDYDGLTEHAVARLKKPVDRLKSVVSPVELGERLAVVQIESLDDALVGLSFDGKPVIPRLNEWTKQGTYMRVQAPKVNGSCDADFALLFGALPSNKMAPYRIPRFPFERSLVNVLHDRGVSTAIFHGVNGNFFERRAAFEKMEFHRMIFREELIREQKIENPEWTLEDGRLFRYATATRKNKDRFFEFTITGTSHTPFRFSLEGHERTFFPQETDRSYTYFDTFNYVDKVLGQYVDELPPGTVVLIYGDHWSRVENPKINYRSQVIDEFGIVPAILFRKTSDGVEPLFEIDEKLAKSAQLRLVDVTAWFRAALHISPAGEPGVAGLAAGR
jgi:hypothetical protein